LSKKQHDKQLQQARERRRKQAFARKQRRQRIIIIVMVALMVLSLVAVGLGSLFADDGTGTPEIDPLDEGEQAADEPPVAEDEVAEGPCPSPAGDLPAPVTEPYDDPPRYDVDPDVTYRVRLDTTCGEILVELDTDGSPRTAENFLALAADGYYEGSPFHRVIEGFMAQGGDPTGTGTGCLDAGCEERLPGYQFEDELTTAEALPASDAPGTVVYPRGVIAMANSGPNTQGSQFFIMHQDSPLPPAYSVFGEVVEGIEVVDDIVGGPVAGDQALDPVIVRSVDIEEA
jgi:cyclophilin family peptidyl-prolyl cis-trans isomerase